MKEVKGIEYEGKPVEADEIDIVSESTPWHVFKLEDGTEVRVKTLLSKIVRVRNKFHDDGRPIYFLNVGPAMLVESPQSLYDPSRPQVTPATTTTH